jgi:di/tricarboxylate transporter
VIGTIAVAVFAMTGIVRDEDLGTGISWSLLLYLGGIFGLANVMQEYKVADWFAGFFVPVARQIVSSTLIVMIVMALAMYVLRFIDPSSFIAISVLFLSVVDVTTTAGTPPLVLMAPIVMASVPFWLSYQNFWVAMGEGITANQAFGPRQRLRLANAYAVITVISLVVALGYWRLIGVLN